MFFATCLVTEEELYDLIVENIKTLLDGADLRHFERVLRSHTDKNTFFWELFAYYCVLSNEEISNIKYSLGTPEKDLTFEYNSETYHLEITGKHKRSDDATQHLARLTETGEVLQTPEIVISQESRFTYESLVRKFQEDYDNKVLVVYEQRMFSRDPQFPQNVREELNSYELNDIFCFMLPKFNSSNWQFISDLPSEKFSFLQKTFEKGLVTFYELNKTHLETQK